VPVSPWFVVVGLALLGIGLLVSVGRRHARALARLRATRPEREGTAAVDPLRARGLTRWMQLAGYAGEHAVAGFVAWQVVALVAGLAAGLALASSGWVILMSGWAADVPGGFGGLFLPILALAPWLLGLLVASLPLLVVRARRRRRVARVEQDLPVVLELLATLGEAGLGFDAALSRVLGSLDPGRPLARAFRLHRRDLLAGVSRVDSLRHLAARLDVPSVSMLVSALLQSELVGAALADTLRAQSSDLWNRRREQALAAAQSLPSRLAVPLVVCFLPALFVITLGPILVDFIELAEGVLGAPS